MKRTDITDIFPEATDEQIDKLMDLNGTDINTAKHSVAGLRSQLTAAQNRLAALEAEPPAPSADLAAAQQRAAELEGELNALKAANALRDIRATVSKETSVPAELLTAETEEACRAQAQGILDFAKPAGYPAVRDGGEVTGGHATGDKLSAGYAKLAADLFGDRN